MQSDSKPIIWIPLIALLHWGVCLEDEVVRWQWTGQLDTPIQKSLEFSSPVIFSPRAIFSPFGWSVGNSRPFYP